MASVLEEKDAIRELIAQYCFHIDALEFGLWLTLLTDDGVFEIPGMARFEGKDALRGFLHTLPLTYGKLDMRHCVMNTIIDVRGATATSRSYFTVVHGRPQVIHRNLAQRQEALWEPAHPAGERMLVHRRTTAAHPGMEPPARRVRRQTKRHEQALPGRPALLVHRPAARNASQPDFQPAPAPVEEFAAPSQWGGMGKTDEWQAFSQPSVMNVEALTDAVIRQIDRCIIARRERLGKI